MSTQGDAVRAMVKMWFLIPINNFIIPDETPRGGLQLYAGRWEESSREDVIDEDLADQFPCHETGFLEDKISIALPLEDCWASLKGVSWPVAVHDL